MRPDALVNTRAEDFDEATREACAGCGHHRVVHAGEYPRLGAGPCMANESGMYRCYCRAFRAAR